MRPLYPLIKSSIDRSVALIALVVLSPLFVLIALLLKCSSSRRVFFVHPRPGLHGATIHILKFKTMDDRRDDRGELLPHHQRITRLGSFLRRTSLDELPQLINILRGDLSFVGPRPLEMRYLPLYTPLQQRRHLVKPGLSGWAQVNGRNAINWDQKLDYDVYYVDHQSFLLDAKIVLLTLQKVLSGTGVNAGEHQTVEPFDVYLQRTKHGI